MRLKANISLAFFSHHLEWIRVSALLFLFLLMSNISSEAQLVNHIFKDTVSIAELDERILGDEPFVKVELEDTVFQGQLITVLDSSLIISTQVIGMINPYQDSLIEIQSVDIVSISYGYKTRLRPWENGTVGQVFVRSAAATVVGYSISPQAVSFKRYVATWGLISTCYFIIGTKTIVGVNSSFSYLPSDDFKPKVAKKIMLLPDYQQKDSLSDLELIRNSYVYRKHAAIPRFGLDVGIGITKFLANPEPMSDPVTLTLRSELSYQMLRNNFGFAIGFSYTEGPSSYEDMNQHSLTEHFSYPSIYGFVDYSILQYDGINVKNYDILFGLGVNYTQLRGVQTIFTSVPNGGISSGDRRRYRTTTIGPCARFKVVRYFNSKLSVSFDWQQRFMPAAVVDEYKLGSNTSSGEVGFDEHRHEVGGSFIHVGIGVLF